MPEIEFSSMLDPNPSLGLGDDFYGAFTSQNQIKVKRRRIDWLNAWDELVKIGLSSKGPDVSEIGSTWLGGFHAMETIRPIMASNIGFQLFPKAAWQACTTSNANFALGIPWTVDIRVVLYRRNWLHKAGVDETAAFADSNQFLETLKKVKAAGHPSPLGIATSRIDNRVFHDMASWVWSAGGDIRSENGRKMLLTEAKSRRGMEDYFRLHEFIAPESFGLIEPGVAQDFIDGKTAVAVLTEKTYYLLKNQAGPEALENIGMAKLMHVPFIGGTALAVWRHSPSAQESLKLIQELSSVRVGKILYEEYRITPANLNSLQNTSLAADPFYSVIINSLNHGRCVPNSYRWGGVESRLIAVIEQMWNDLHENPHLNIADEVAKRFTELCDRLEQTILEYY
jgi:multiple sugar transport system substrate-binding protein